MHRDATCLVTTAYLSLAVSACGAAADQFPAALPQPVVIDEPGLERCLFFGDRLALLFDDSHIEFREPPNGKRLGQIKIPGNKRGVFDWVVTPDGSKFFILRLDEEDKSAYLPNRIEAFRANDGTSLWSASGIDQIWCQAVSRDGKLLAIGCSNYSLPPEDWKLTSEIRILDAETGKVVKRLPRKKSEGVDALAFSTSGRELAAGYSEDGALVLWDWDVKRSSLLSRTKMAWTDASIPELAYNGLYLLAVQHRETGIPHLTPLGGEGYSATDTSLTLWDTKSRTLALSKDAPHLDSVLVSPSGGSYVTCQSENTGEFDKEGKPVTPTVNSTVTVWSAGVMIPAKPLRLDGYVRLLGFSKDRKCMLASCSKPTGKKSGPLGTEEYKASHLIWTLPDWFE